jgi:hypothetical protein
MLAAFTSAVLASVAAMEKATVRTALLHRTNESPRRSDRSVKLHDMALKGQGQA